MILIGKECAQTMHRRATDTTSVKAVFGPYRAVFAPHTAVFGQYRAVFGLHRAGFGLYRPVFGPYRAVSGLYRVVSGFCKMYITQSHNICFEELWGTRNLAMWRTPPEQLGSQYAIQWINRQHNRQYNKGIQKAIQQPNTYHDTKKLYAHDALMFSQNH